ncbi:hypothetical protein J2Z18_004441 [Paenibacillus lactis]|jgi:hypothetical protein|uniref:Uncharacterized protein n=1 Tax=Paenibacillus lactis TaxID=228574 RepID=A0ABS4FGE3_9BACL|nr:hypothetical protein [Paenibacillus lactis]
MACSNSLAVLNKPLVGNVIAVLHMPNKPAVSAGFIHL